MPVALLTGASSGVGRAAAVRLAEAGFDLGLVARTTDALARTVEDVRQTGRRACGIPADLADASAVSGVVSRIVAALGPVDVLVNDAATVHPLAPVVGIEIEAWRRALATNLTGPLLLMRELLPSMLSQGRGVVLNVASILGRRPVPGFGAYGATKAGLEQLSRVLAAEVGPRGVRVHVLYPGVTDTPMLADIVAAPDGTFPDDVAWRLRGSRQPGRSRPPDVPARAIAWLVSEHGATWNDILFDVDDPLARAAAGLPD